VARASSETAVIGTSQPNVTAAETPDTGSPSARVQHEHRQHPDEQHHATRMGEWPTARYMADIELYAYGAGKPVTKL
jgi:hypothetical protein